MYKSKFLLFEQVGAYLFAPLVGDSYIAGCYSLDGQHVFPQLRTVAQGRR